MPYNYAVDKQLVSAEAFCAKIDSLITAFGGTPTDVELSPSAMKSEANFRHQVTDELFQAKLNQLVAAMGGTPSAIVPTSGNGYAATHGYVDMATFGDKLDEIAENAGGGGESVILSTVHVTNNYTRAIQVSHFHPEVDPSTGDTVLAFTPSASIAKGSSADVCGGFWSLKAAGRLVKAFLLVTATGAAVNVPTGVVTTPDTGVTVTQLSTNGIGGHTQSVLIQVQAGASAEYSSVVNITVENG